jgi:broad specificity phosphatase PhoE
VTKLFLVAHALDASLRQAVFGGTTDLDPAGEAQARELVASSNWVHDADLVLTDPAPACRQTVAARGPAAKAEDALADCDYGRWAGRTLAEVAADEPDGVQRWLTDPAAAPHGGESLADLVRRTGRWLDALATERRTRVVAVTHAAVVRAAVVHVLGAAPNALWQVDVPPLAVVRLDARGPRWRLTLDGATGR